LSRRAALRVLCLLLLLLLLSFAEQEQEQEQEPEQAPCPFGGNQDVHNNSYAFVNDAVHATRRRSRRQSNQIGTPHFGLLTAPIWSFAFVQSNMVAERDATPRALW
jgi:hypothetical protein